MKRTILLVALLLSVSTPAFPADLSVVISDMADRPMMIAGRDADGKEGPVPMTVARAILDALVAPFEDEKALSGEERTKRFALALRVNKVPKDIKLTTADIELIKRLVAKAWPGALIYGRVLQAIDPNSVGE